MGDRFSDFALPVLLIHSNMLQRLNVSMMALSIIAQASFVPSRPCKSLRVCREIYSPSLCMTNNNGDENNTQEPMGKGGSSNNKKKKKKDTAKDTKKKDLLSILSNPYQAGKSLRQTLDDAITSLGPKLSSSSTSSSSPLTSSEQRSVYYLDDRFIESTPRILTPGAIAFAQRSNTLIERAQKQVYIPEVLVIGATTALGRCIVQRLLLDGRFRVRVLVRDLYSRTLNMFGTGVTYCQGDLFDPESLEYALTDVDKIVFCEGAPKQDEENFKEAFDKYFRETFEENRDTPSSTVELDDLEYRYQVIALRAKLAEQVDVRGMRNLIQAYHNVRHADYGTSQVAKRTLFKFKEGKDDFDLFSLDLSDNTSESDNNSRIEAARDMEPSNQRTSPDMNTRSSNSMYGRISSQARWIKNSFGHGVFTGRVKGSSLPTNQDQASIISGRLRSRENPDRGVDLSNGFGGFILRICSDGKKYEMFIRTGTYETEKIEYVCQFSTASKIQTGENKSKNSFITIRLPFSRFKPRTVLNTDTCEEISCVPFQASDVQCIGFRFRQEYITNGNDSLLSAIQLRRWTKFYLALNYIKTYRSQNDPEFFYLSDARLPPFIGKDMVRHDLRRIVLSSDNDSSIKASKLFDEAELKIATGNPKDRTEEEIYYKYMGETIIKNSGLCYAIARISELNELPSGEFSTVRLHQSGSEMMTPVSRAEVADVCVSALLDSNASNICFYVSKSKPGIDPPVDIIQVEKTSKFMGLQPE